MRILSAVDGSVLWLLQSTEAAARHARQEAHRRGVSADRLIFGRRKPAREHLVRHGAADLFLDTFPYNAHTTATDALWAGLPIVTRSGESFASRVGASLLTTMGLAELVTTTPEQYERLAIDIAHDRPRLAALKMRLHRAREATPLFDGARLTADLERAYTRMFERRERGFGPEHIDLAETETD
jgi:predicted O-linked N-acetylglucosamine transferase (SPINDLY family)